MNVLHSQLKCSILRRSLLQYNQHSKFITSSLRNSSAKNDINSKNSDISFSQFNDHLNSDHHKKAKPMSRAMTAYLEHAKKHDSMIRKARIEFEIGKRHLANMMGESPETFTQEDIDSAIEYLFPSGLFVQKARPVMKPPEEIYMAKQSVEFDVNGRPFHFLFYTRNANLFQTLYDFQEHIENLYKYEDVMRQKKMLPDPNLKIQLFGYEIIRKEQLEYKLLESIADKQYAKFVHLFERLIELPFSYTLKDYIMTWLTPLSSQSPNIIPYEAKTDEQGRKFVKMFCSPRKQARAEVTVYSPGTGKITINGYDISYFEDVQDREQILFPLVFTDMVTKVDIEVTVKGSGHSAQAGAIRFGVSEALLAFVSREKAEDMRLAGLLQRDVRRRERKKFGQEGARRQFTWKKR